MPTLSVIIITKNEQSRIGDCIKSVQGFAHEIIVVDSSSTDQTVEIARSLGAKVTTTSNWEGFGIQKNKALSLATGEWVFSVDADERPSNELVQEIHALLSSTPSSTCYLIERRSWYCGKLIKYSGWQNDKILRLFKRGFATFTNDPVHERLELLSPSKPAQLKGILDHYRFEDFDQVLDKVNRYSTLWAQSQHSKGRKSSPSKALLHALSSFLKTYLLKLGFLDGLHGLALAISNAEGAYYKYIKLWHLGLKESLEP